jgi:outer membrane autotransporter protein
MVGFHAEEKKTHAYYGVGVDYRFAPNLSVGAEATRYRIGLGGTDDVDAFTASLTYHFR